MILWILKQKALVQILNAGSRNMLIGLCGLALHMLHGMKVCRPVPLQMTNLVFW